QQGLPPQLVPVLRGDDVKAVEPDQRCDHNKVVGLGAEVGEVPVTGIAGIEAADKASLLYGEDAGPDQSGRRYYGPHQETLVIALQPLGICKRLFLSG